MELPESGTAFKFQTAVNILVEVQFEFRLSFQMARLQAVRCFIQIAHFGFQSAQCSLKCDEMVIISGVGLTLPGEFWIGDITGSNVLIGEGFGEGQLVGNKF